MIIGKNIDLRKIEINDAEFVLELRLDPMLNQYINPVENDINKQKDWIKLCNADLEQWYFIVQNKKKESVGTIRIYDIEEDSFCWGSWIIKPEARSYASFESVILLYKYAFYDLGFNHTYFDVRKKNEKALNFYLRLGAEIIDENELDFFLIYKKEFFLLNQSEYEVAIDKIWQKHQNQ